MTNWEDRLAQRVRNGSDTGAIASIMAETESTDVITFSGGFPAPETFPAAVVADLTAASLRANACTAMQYSPTRGLGRVRDAVAGWLAGRGDPRPPMDELMITSGGIDALGLLAKSYLDPGDVVAVESPTYLGAIMAFASYQAQVVGVHTDHDGLDPNALADLLGRGTRPKLLYTIPDYQNPTGLNLAAERRSALVDLCRRYGVLIVEDVAYRELGFQHDLRSPSLWSLGSDVVVQIGTFSKTFFPGVRLGWASAPVQVIEAMVNAKQNSDQCSGALGQWLVEGYLRGGHMDAQLLRSQALYRARCTATLAALEAHMPDGASWTRPDGGFFTWLSLPPGRGEATSPAQARAAGVSFVPGGLFYPGDTGRDELRLSFSCVDEQAISRGIERLGRLVS